MSAVLASESEFAVVLLNQEGTIVEAHASCKDSLGWNREELQGKDIGELLQSDRELLMAQLLQTQGTPDNDGQTSFSIRIVACRRNQTSFPARVVVRRFDQTEYCTVAFYRVGPQDSETPPNVRPEEIELAMKAGTSGERFATKPAKKIERTKSLWRNSRLLFGSKAQPAPAPEPPAPSVNPAIPAVVFQQKLKARPEVPPPPSNELESLVEEAFPQGSASDEIAEAKEELAVQNESPVQTQQTQVSEESTQSTADQEPTDANLDSVLKELEHEREERRRHEQRATSQSTQIRSLHLELTEHLDIEARNQKRIGTLEEQLRESKTLLSQQKAELSNERERAKAATEQLQASTTLSTRLEEQLSALQLVHEALERTQAETENQLQAVTRELKESQDAVAVEKKQKQQHEIDLEKLVQERTDEERKWKLETRKLESALKAKELELKQLEVTQAQQDLQARS